MPQPGEQDEAEAEVLAKRWPGVGRGGESRWAGGGGGTEQVGRERKKNWEQKKRKGRQWGDTVATVTCPAHTGCPQH